ncbi:MAG: calcium/sodium antiporter [Lentisphaeria bacterium]|nr:calcium/sodium antiporter [Lentisphaeria bacterium]
MLANTPAYLNAIFFAVGLLVIIKGSDLFLDSAVWMARSSGVSQLIIGATIVSVCTTLPEAISSLTASLKGAGDMALGNALGSIICNSGFILGFMLLFVTAKIRRKPFIVRGIFLLSLLILTFLLALPTPLFQSIRLVPPPFEITRLGGAVLLLGVVLYLAVTYWECRHEAQDEREEAPESEAESEAEDVLDGQPSGTWRQHLSRFALGGALVAIGAYLLIEFGQRLARNVGVSEAVISLLFVAFGTSLPELFTAISAVRKRAHDISVGNVVGANVLNIALVTGGASAARPLLIQDPLLIRFDLPFAFGLCLLVFLEGAIFGKIGKKTGLVLVFAYISYLGSMLLLGRLGA